MFHFDVLRGSAALTILSAVLVACGSSGVVQPGPTPTPPGSGCVPDMTISAVQSMAGEPGDGAAFSMDATPDATPDWSAPRVRGQVLAVSAAGGLSAQSLSALSGTTARQLSPDVTLLRTPAGQSDEAFAASLRARGLHIQPDYLYRTQARPNDPGAPRNAGITVGGAVRKQTYLDRINVQSAWDYLAARCSVDLAPVMVAVLDTGVRRAHPDLAGQLLPGRDFCSALDSAGQKCTGTDDDPSEVGGSNSGHGTSSAGLIGAATNNGLGIAGVAWSGTGTKMLSKILPIKIFGDNGGESGAPTSALVQGLDYARTQGARVANMSLGFVEGPEADPALASAIGRADAAGMVMIAAAGNTASEGLYYPASDPRVLSVGALGASDSLACYSARPSAEQSSRGIELDLAAPGGSSPCGSGSDILTLMASSTSPYGQLVGTSEAAPQVAGVAALIRAYKPGLSAAQVRAVLRGSARSVNGVRILDAGAAVRLAETPPR